MTAQPLTESSAWHRYQLAIMAVGSGINMTFAQASAIVDTYADWVRVYLDGPSAEELIAERRRIVARFLRNRTIQNDAA